MSGLADPALEIARRLAEGLAVDAETLAGLDAGLARGFSRLAAIRRSKELVA